MNFLLKFKDVHGDRFDYSRVSNRIGDKVEIICPKHGSFYQNIYKHINGQGCPECKRDKAINSTNFIDRSKILHNDEYDYSKVIYRGLKIPVEIICPKHGSFTQMPYLHLRGRGCAKCGIEKSSIKKRVDPDEFIKRSNIIHNNKYDYYLLDFKNTRSKVEIICPKHGAFSQNANSHLLGSGCPICKSSKGEIIIMNILDKYSIEYISEYRFSDCKVSYRLPFDFFLPEKNTCIEYDGIQHFKPIDFFGGLEAMKKLQQYDKIKNQYCVDKKINIIRFKYTDEIDFIEESIKSILSH